MPAGLELLPGIMMDSKHWFRKAIIYQVFIDRFHGFHATENFPGFLGGNIPGVTQKVDYLHGLGINVIWLSPFYTSASYHGYHITDFKRVDPHFGTEKDLPDLINAAKSRGMRVIADFVPNHCSARHPYFRQAIKERSSKYRKWFVFKKWPEDYLCFLNFKELPKLNLENEETRDYMIEVADYWLSLGIDGYRIDHVIGPSHNFWKEFSHAINKKHPEAILIGEAWAQGLQRSLIRTTGIKRKWLRKVFGIPQEVIQLEYYHELDGVLDFVLNDMVKNAVRNGRDLLEDSALNRMIRSHLRKVPPDYYMVTFLDNHDMDRFIRYCDGNVETLLRAFELLLSLDNPVVIYNGTENCLSNEVEVNPMEAHSDLQVRNPVDWKNINRDFVEGFQALVKRYRGIH
jgi:glycosidase